MTILQKCCYCLELEVGIAILGWVGSVLAVIDISVLIISLTTEPQYFSLYSFIYLIILFMTFIVAVCLIRATQTKNKHLVIMWLVVCIIDLIFLNFSLMQIVIHNTVISGKGLEKSGAHIATTLLADTLGVYFWICVYSYYQELDASTV